MSNKRIEQIDYLLWKNPKPSFDPEGLCKNLDYCNNF